MLSWTFYSARISQNLGDNLPWFKPMLLLNWGWIFHVAEFESCHFPDWNDKLTLQQPVCFPENIWGDSPCSIGIIMFYHYLRTQSQAATSNTKTQISVSPINFPVNCYIPISVPLSSCASINFLSHSSTGCRWKRRAFPFSLSIIIFLPPSPSLFTTYITLTHVDNSHHCSFVCCATEVREE